MKYKVNLNGKTYEVEVERGEAQLISVTDIQPIAANIPVAASPPAAAVVSAAPTAAPVQAAPTAAVTTAAGEIVKAPMPGVILDIKVAVGQRVSKGDVLIILEAMKMENEIAAPIDGTIAQIAAAKGTQVKTGDPILVLA